MGGSDLLPQAAGLQAHPPSGPAPAGHLPQPPGSETCSVSPCRVPLITLFHCAFQDSKHIYIVMEHCTGGDLLERLLKEGRAMHEHRVALEIAHPLLSALAQMHQLRIIHR